MQRPALFQTVSATIIKDYFPICKRKMFYLEKNKLYIDMNRVVVYNVSAIMNGKK